MRNPDDLDNVTPVGSGPVPDDSGGSEPPRTPPDDLGPQPDPEPIRLCSEFPLNDFGNGKRFATHFGSTALYVGQVAWHCWDGKRWKRDDEIAKEISPGVRTLAQKIGALIEKEVDHLEPTKREKALIAEEIRLHEQRNKIEENGGATTEELKSELISIDARLRTIDASLKDRKSLIGRRLTHAKNAGNSNTMSNMLKEAQVLLWKSIEDMDSNALVVNCDNYTLEFERYVDDHDAEWAKEESTPPLSARVKRKDHDQADNLTKLMPVEYDPEATCPMFDAFFERVQPIPEMRRFLQRWFGLSMTGLTGEQKLVFMHGAGANGKSVLVDLLAKMMGDYAATAKIQSLTGRDQRKGSDATPDLMHLIGARFVRASEPEEGERLQEAMIKALTGGEEMLVRALHMNFVEFLPEFKLTISGNHKPEIRGTDDGIWRRFLMVPFDVQIPKDERDPLLGQKLWQERSGILNWLIEGLLDYLKNGLQEPDQVLVATQQFREDSDPVGAFLTECAHVSGHEGDFMSSRQLIDAFNFWLEDKGETRWGGRTVSLRLKDKANKWKDPTTGRSFIPGKSSVTGYRGIKLNAIFQGRIDEVEGRASGSSRNRSGASEADFP